MKITMLVNEHSKEIKFLKSLTGNNQNIFDTHYFGNCNDFRKLSVPLAGTEPLQSKKLLYESETIQSSPAFKTLRFSIQPVSFLI